MHKAKEEPKRAAISGELSWSTLNTVLTTWTSFLKPSSNNGLIGRSIKRATKVAFSVGRPSRLINPPGIFPTEYNFSWYKTVNGKKSAIITFLLITANDKIAVSSYRTKTAPLACLANSPISTKNFLPLKFNSYTFFMFHLF